MAESRFANVNGDAIESLSLGLVGGDSPRQFERELVNEYFNAAVQGKGERCGSCGESRRGPSQLIVE